MDVLSLSTQAPAIGHLTLEMRRKRRDPELSVSELFVATQLQHPRKPNRVGQQDSSEIHL
jgi:hypothetical protein